MPSACVGGTIAARWPAATSLPSSTIAHFSKLISDLLSGNRDAPVEPEVGSAGPGRGPRCLFFAEQRSSCSIGGGRQNYYFGDRRQHDDGSRDHWSAGRAGGDRRRWWAS